METQRKEVETELDRGLIAFLGTITAWLTAAFIVGNVLIWASNLQI